MKLYVLEPRYDEYLQKYLDFARFSHVGTWETNVICRGCDFPPSRLVSPLMIEWEPDSDNIGDFSYCAYTSIVTNRVKNLLSDNSLDFEFGEVRVVAPTTEVGSRKAVPYPYTGPTLYWLMPTRIVPLNETDSGLTIKSRCQVCHRTRYNFQQNGIFVRSQDRKGADVFCVEQFAPSNSIYLTQRAVDVIDRGHFTNFCYRHCGFVH